jgi:hypothetical protein
MPKDDTSDAPPRAYAVESILSLNSADFKRYDLVTALDPASLLDGVS